MEITVVGVGKMGSAFAKRVHSLGFKTYWWSRSKKEAPGVAIEKLSDARGLVVIFVSDDAALYEVTADVGGDYIALAGTYSIDAVRRVIDILTARGKKAFAMPVVGSPRHVESGEAIYIIGASESVYQTLRLTLEKFGLLYYIGDSVKAAALKLAFNSLLISTVSVLGEAYSLTTRYGIPPHQFKELLKLTVFREIAERYMDRLTGGGKPTFTIRDAAKDVRYATNAAGERQVGYAAVSGVRILYELLTAMGHGDEDYARAGVLETKWQ